MQQPLFVFLMNWTIVLALVALIAAFIFYPAPSLSPNHLAWMNRGSYFKYNDYYIFYIDELGSGSIEDAVVCFHGFPTSSYDWVKVIDGLKQQFHKVILLDFLGYGFSEKPRNHNYTIGEQADIVEALLKELRVKRVHILSHDFGDTVALEMLARFDSKPSELKGGVLQSLCMLNGGIFQGLYHPRLIQKLLRVPVLSAILSRLTFYQVFRKGFEEIFGTQNPPTEEEFKEFYAVVKFRDGHIVLPGLLQYIDERQFYKERWEGALQQSSIPVHMIYGPADPVNPPPFAEHYRKVVPGSSLHVLVSRIGHYPQWEAPNDVLRSYIEFLDVVSW
ncbi:hypothetical protein ScPMuIL_008758 [Solemya velum]